MSLHPEQIELTDEETESIRTQASKFLKEDCPQDSHAMRLLIYDLKSENLEYKLIISKFNV